MTAISHRIIFGDARQMRGVEDSSVHLVVTSPPYWQLKDYGTESQIGFNDSYEEYINNLGLVWAECRRVLDGGCRLCINIGDQFARAVYYGRYKVIPIKTEIIKSCEALGLDYMGAIIWQKSTTSNTTGGGSVMGSYPYPRNGIIKIDYESILVFKKLGTPHRKASAKEKDLSKLTAQEWNLYFSGHWNFRGERQDKHLAMFPLELPHRLVKMFSFAGDVVLDPFAGSATTSLAAAKLGRHSVAYEINAEFEQLIRNKMSSAPADADIRFSREDAPDKNTLRAVVLPYTFKDTAPLKRITDPKKFQFGSKIDANGGGQHRDEFFHVREVLNPMQVLLSNGMSIRLLGVKPLKNKEAEAVTFIRNKTTGQKVFVKFDATKHDKEGNLLCYLYLSNKTLINAHLIKSGLAFADMEVPHRHLARFVKYQEIENV